MKTEILIEGPHRRRNGVERTSGKKCEGFTIIEMIIVVALLAIVGAIAIPSFQRYAVNGNLRSAAKDLVSDFNALKGRAMAENQEYRLTIAGNSYTIERCTGTASPCAGWGPPPAGVAPSKTPAAFSAEIVMTPNSTYVFQTRGIVTPTPVGGIIMTNSRGSTATLTVNTAGRTSAQFTMH